MSNLIVKEADSSISETLATGTGSTADPKIPGFQSIDPATGSSTLEYDDAGRPRTPVHVEHLHWRAFNTHLHNVTGPNTTLSVAAAAGDTQLAVANSTGIASGKIFIEGASSRETDSIKVLSEATNIIQIAKPLQNSYPIGTPIKKVTLNLAKNGTRSSPVIFELKAPPGPAMHIETINWYIETPDQPFDKLFGGGPALANGIYMRSINDGVYNDWGIFRINQRFRVFDYDVETLSFATGPQADWALWAKKNFRQNESGVIRLDPATNDVLQVLVQDDLTATEDYTEVEVVAGGHFEI
jgi:hypothetical protein